MIGLVGCIKYKKPRFEVMCIKGSAKNYPCIPLFLRGGRGVSIKKTIFRTPLYVYCTWYITEIVYTMP